jgi:hypothetical protein
LKNNINRREITLRVKAVEEQYKEMEDISLSEGFDEIVVVYVDNDDYTFVNKEKVNPYAEFCKKN